MMLKTTSMAPLAKQQAKSNYLLRQISKMYVRAEENKFVNEVVRNGSEQLEAKRLDPEHIQEFPLLRKPLHDFLCLSQL